MLQMHRLLCSMMRKYGDTAFANELVQVSQLTTLIYAINISSEFFRQVACNNVGRGGALAANDATLALRMLLKLSQLIPSEVSQ